MEIASNVKQRKRNAAVNKPVLNLIKEAQPKASRTRGKPSPKKKASPRLKSLSKAKKITARRNNTPNSTKRGRISRLLFAKTKKKTPDKNGQDVPAKPAFYRTRNAATADYEEKLEAVRAASLDLKKLTKTCAKKESNLEADGFTPSPPKFETINESRVLACGLWFKVGDIISVYGDERAHFKTYFAQILLFLQDRYGEQYCDVRWLIPISLESKVNFASSNKFDFNNYLEGPRHTEPIKISNINFVSHAPRGAGTVMPGIIGHLQPNPSFNQYRQRNETKILDVPTRTATTIDQKLRNPYFFQWLIFCVPRFNYTSNY
ncbi:unnamed protein product [Allacma fusca]|uniref:BAH domain-containing protein n=1 Tax=Allacma fusca TaxID=39272 RepID=A0A8J2J3C7_9HEXA|nr:unnamed protein product [Allacma fusca]